ncbi:MAG TPA: MiaB/RimO family radical SAM methylthiotransferase [Longimicrobiales bacterium]|nr:MiaB/RimO family radical SAM methylthiotransferase [Longimicrobiales bacterium]
MTQTSARRTAYVETYGCQMNVSDGELMQGILAAGGYHVVSRPEDADVVLVNTCAIREHAEQRVIGRVGELNRLKAARPDMVIGVTGCMAQRLGERLLEQASYVDLVMGPDAYRTLPETLRRLRPRATGLEGVGRDADPAGDAPSVPDEHPRAAGAGTRRSLPVLGAAIAGAGSATGEATEKRPVSNEADAGDERLAVLEFHGDENYEGLEVRRASKITAWVPVQRGCNHRCTYCIVPYVRGSEKNRSLEHVLDEVRGIAAQGITEVTLLGQTVNSWEHGGRRFHELLREVARVDGIRRVRFTSPHPNDVTPELVEVMATEPAVCNQLHLPLQSGHDRTLKRMLRRYTVGSFLDKVRMVRDAIHDIALSTDVIVAFPGETDAEYEATLDLMRTVRFDDAFLYKYSPREGTPATRLPMEQFVDPGVAQERLQRLIDLHRSIQNEINAAEVGRVEEVLVERQAKSPGDMLGRTARYKSVAFPGDASLVGRYLTVRLTGTTGATFRGQRADPPAAVRSVA